MAAEKSKKLESRPSVKRIMVNKGAWTAEEDKRLADYIHSHGPKKWKTVALRAGLNRCGKSCRLRWLNYLRPNIKRGNISQEEEALILRLHKLLGNRWSLIAGRLPGRTDNEIKNYWNSHLSKKVNRQITPKYMEFPGPPVPVPIPVAPAPPQNEIRGHDDLPATGDINGASGSDITFDVTDLFDFSSEPAFGFDWVNKFLQLDDDPSN